MRRFARQSIKGGRVCVFNQYYKSEICDDILKIISEEIYVTGNIYNIIEAYLEYKDKHFKNFQKEYEIQYNEYRDEDIEEKEILFEGNLGELPIHQSNKQKKLNEFLWDYDGNS